MNTAAQLASASAAAPTRHRVFETGLKATVIGDLKQIVDRTLGRRVPLAEGDRDQKWWINLADLLASHGEGPVEHVILALASSPMMAWCREQLGNDLVAILNYCIFRRFDPVRNPVPAAWHFDANIFGLQAPIVNLWIPLVDVGVSAPGISLVDVGRRPASLWTRMAEIAVAEGGRFNSRNRGDTLFAPAEVNAAMEIEADLRVVTPTVRAGGAIAFDHQFLHATQEIQPGMGVRDSFEFRVMPTEVARRIGAGDRLKIARMPRPAD